VEDDSIIHTLRKRVILIIGLLLKEECNGYYTNPRE
jgi:hypothetical protein